MVFSLQQIDTTSYSSVSCASDAVEREFEQIVSKFYTSFSTSVSAAIIEDEISKIEKKYDNRHLIRHIKFNELSIGQFTQEQFAILKNMVKRVFPSLEQIEFKNKETISLVLLKSTMPSQKIVREPGEIPQQISHFNLSCPQPARGMPSQRFDPGTSPECKIQ